MDYKQMDGFDSIIRSLNNSPIVNETNKNIRPTKGGTQQEENVILLWSVFGFLYVVIGIASIIGNSLVCIVAVMNKRMRNVSNFFIANQAFSDIILTIMILPFLAYSQLSQNWPFGEALCQFAIYGSVVSTCVSSFMLVAIAMDRYRYIIYPRRRQITIYNATAIAILIWVASFLISIPYALSREIDRGICTISDDKAHQVKYISLGMFIVRFVIPLVLITVAYCHIGIRISQSGVSGDASRRRQIADNRAKRRTNYKLVIIVGAFAVCWCPLYVYTVLQQFRYQLKQRRGVYLFLQWFAMSSICINAFAFVLLNKNIRRELKETFCRKRAINVRATQVIPLDTMSI